MKVALIGSGKMGLPIAAFMASRQLDVTACDINEELVGIINRGECPLDEPGLGELMHVAHAGGFLKATTATEDAVSVSNVVVVIVPAMINDEYWIDLEPLKVVTKQIASAMKPGLLVCYETTVAVGTVRNVFVPMLEEGGLKCGEDFHVVFSPERVKSRMIVQRLSETPKVVGGFNEESSRLGSEFYDKALGTEVLDVGTLEAAEFTKLVGMLYRDVNIALVNQLSRYAEAIGMDLSRIIPAANTNGEAHLLTPGIGVGGHCAPVYPWFIIRDAERAGVDLSLATLARETNTGQAEHVVARLEEAMSSLDGSRVLILGVAFRPEVKETAFSPAFLIRDALTMRNADVYLHDHHYTASELADLGFTSGDYDDAAGWDAIVLNTAHLPYEFLDFAALHGKGLQAVVDGRNLWRQHEVEKAGVKYLGIGR